MFEYALENEDTGNEIFREITKLTMRSWHIRIEKRLLRDKRISKETKEAIQNHITVVGWANSNTLKLAGQDVATMCQYVYKGYDKFYKNRKAQVNV